MGLHVRNLLAANEGDPALRARNLKPGFFTNEDLAFASPIHQVIYAGLWCIADRRGVLEDRPQRIHTLVNPGRSLAQTRASLGWLEERKFIARYEAGNTKLIKVLQFGKHQNPHRDEKPNEHPDYGVGTVPAQYSNGNGTVPAEKSTESAGLIPSSLNPDSGFLNPYSPPTPPNGTSVPPGGEVRETRITRADRKAEAEIAWKRLTNSDGELGRDDPRVQRGIREAGGWSRISMRQSGIDAARLQNAFIAGFLKDAAA